MEVLFFMFVFFILIMKSARYGPSAFLRGYYQIYPEKPLRLFGVLVLMLAVRRE